MGVPSTLNVYHTGPPLIRHSVWRWWRSLLMLCGESGECCREAAHWFFTAITRRHVPRVQCRDLQQENASLLGIIRCSLLTWYQLSFGWFQNLNSVLNGKACLGWRKNSDILVQDLKKLL
jgi:hypothetical protein